MKEIKELKFEELTLEQKLGLTMTMTLHGLRLIWRKSLILTLNLQDITMPASILMMLC